MIVDTQDNLDIGLIDSDEDQVTELTHEELIEIFELAYDSKSALAGEIPIDALIKQELPPPSVYGSILPEFPKGSKVFFLPIWK